MAALATTLTSFSTNGDSKVYTTPGHTALLPRLLTQKRRVPTQNGTVASMETLIIRGTKDASGAVLPSKVALSVQVRFPIDMGPSQTELTDALTILKDVVASDEFAANLASQGFIKG